MTDKDPKGQRPATDAHKDAHGDETGINRQHTTKRPRRQTRAADIQTTLLTECYMCEGGTGGVSTGRKPRWASHLTSLC